MEDERPRSRSPMFLTPSSPNEDSAASPSSPMSSQSKRAKFAIDPNLKEVYGLNLGLLRRWQNEKNEKLLSSEEAMQEIAVAKVRGFLDAIGIFLPTPLQNLSALQLMFGFHCFVCNTFNRMYRKDSVLVENDEAVSLI